MPIKNGENYMEEAIVGIKNQNVQKEIIVIDDGSDDNTSKIAEKLGCNVFRLDISKGQVVAKNIGLKIAKGEYILFHDHDDILTSNALMIMQQEFKNNPEIDVVNAKIKDFLSSDCKNQRQTIKQEAYYGCLGGAMLIRKKVFDIIGDFDETITAGEIISLNTKFKQYNIKIGKIDFISSNRRIHDTNYGKTNKNTEFKDYAKLLRERLAR